MECDGKDIRCPRCGSDDVIPIAYGSPSTDMSARSSDGLLHLGCCLIRPENSYCKACENQWEQKPYPWRNVPFTCGYYSREQNENYDRKGFVGNNGLAGRN